MKHLFFFKVFFRLSLSIVAVAITLAATAQRTADYLKDATWIKMIDDPAVNYYEAIKAYNEYWKTHKKPEDPEDRLQTAVKDKTVEPEKDDLTPEEKQFELAMIYQTKRFENWLQEEKPFVQEDGSILTQQQRMAIWKTQQEGKSK